MELSVCLKALGDPTRLTIFQQLLIRKHCTRSLSKKLGISEPAISQHLKICPSFRREGEKNCQPLRNIRIYMCKYPERACRILKRHS